ncbi:MAG: metallopeptidase family protein [Planctomycetes bacterium]|nr:metallopeptidase family protein [Planctomycetota bacterium]
MKVSTDEFEQLVRQAIAEIPDGFRSYLDNIVVDVETMPNPTDLAEVGIDDPTELLGLYHGTPLTERSVEAGVQLPDRVTIYQRNIEAICDSRREIVEQIRTTVLHEIGHFFGMDEDDLFDVGYD